MIKKTIAFVLVAILVFVFAACGDSESPQKSEGSSSKDSPNSNIESRQDPGTEDVAGETNGDDEMEEFSETLTFMGFNFYYPESINLDHFMYGYTFRYQSDVAVLLEAPAIAAEILDVTDVNDAPTAVEEYVIETIETRTRDLFSPSSTAQSITSSDTKTINDIEMLRVEGFFTNTRQEVDVPFVGYYLLRDNQPVYFVGVSLNDDVNVDSFIDKFAGYVIDIKE